MSRAQLVKHVLTPHTDTADWHAASGHQLVWLSSAAIAYLAIGSLRLASEKALSPRGSSRADVALLQH